MRQYLLVLSTVCSFLFTVVLCNAQANSTGVDVIVLKSGTVFRGEIIEYVPNHVYRIKLVDGTVLDLDIKLIETVYVYTNSKNPSLKSALINIQIATLDSTSGKLEVQYGNQKPSRDAYFWGLGLGMKLYYSILPASLDWNSTSVGYAGDIETLFGTKVFNTSYVIGNISLDYGNGIALPLHSTSTKPYTETLLNYSIGYMWEENQYYVQLSVGNGHRFSSSSEYVFNSNLGRYDSVKVSNTESSLFFLSGLLINLSNNIAVRSVGIVDAYRGTINLTTVISLMYSPNLSVFNAK